MAEKILIADDDLETLRLVGLMLQRQGYEIVAAQNGTQALNQARAESPDLIIIDVMMPDVDGYEVTRKLRQEPGTANTPILMFTAKSQVDDKVAGYEAGVDDYLTKPIHPAELAAHIRALLARAKSRGGSAAAGAEAMKPRGYTIGVTAAKGGLGVSTIALNLALQYYMKHKGEVIAAELRPGQGTWGIELGYTNPETLTKLLNLKPNAITASVLENELVRTSFGIRLLLASHQTKDTNLLPGANTQLETILQLLPQMASPVILDIGTNTQPGYERILSLCQEVILVVEPQPATVQRTRVLVNELSEKGFGKSKVLSVVVLNRIRADIQLSAAQVQETLGHSVVQVIPPAPEQSYQAAMRSLPITLIQPEGLLAQQFARLTEAIAQHIAR